MQTKLNIITANRKFIAEIIQSFTEEKLNEIPQGFNNNLVWHFLHLIAVFESLTYKYSGLPMQISDEFLMNYKNGTKPTEFIKKQMIDEQMIFFINQTERLFNDLKNGSFKNYTEFKTRLGISITNIDEAIDFIMFHEAIHLGYMLAQKRLLTN